MGNPPLIYNFIIILLSSIIAYGCNSTKNGFQNAKRSFIPCDINEVLKTEKKIGHVSTKQVFGFVCSLKMECQTNIEFTEFSNKVLFKLLDQEPEVLLSTLADSTLDKRFLYLQLSAPLLDYDIKTLIDKVKKSKGEESIKQQVISNLLIGMGSQ